jgi:serine/threonine protein kinase
VQVLRKEITFEELQQYGFCLFTALAHLHKQGIVHRDVKPGNFLFSRKQRLGYLVDFNLAMVVSKSGRSRRGEVIRESSTATGKVLGKRPCKDTSESCLSKRQQTILRYRAYSHPILLKSDPPLYLKLWNAAVW